MRKLYEIVLVIAAAGLAATVALVEIPTHSDPGTVVGGRSGFSAGPPPIGDSSFPPLPPLLFPPGSSTPVTIEPLATPVPSLALGVQASSNVAQAPASAGGSRGASSAQRAPTSPSAKAPARLKSKPPAAKPKAAPTLKNAKHGPAAKPKPAAHTSKKAKPPIKSKPPHTSKRSGPPAAKPKPRHPSKKSKGERKT